MLTTFLFIIGAIFIYQLWYKVKDIQNSLEQTKEITRLRLIPSDNLLVLPLMREVIGIDKAHWHTPAKDVPEKEWEKIREWTRKNQKVFYQTFTFFWDKELIFSDNDYGAGFANFPYRTQNIYYKELLTTEDGYTIEFNIAFRYMSNVIAGQKIPVFTGYLKKRKLLGSDKEVVILFNYPQAFINPTFYRDKKNQSLIPILEKALEIEPKKDQVGGDLFVNDFGEQEYFSGFGNWNENKYFEFRY